jgi:hypothetical protein
LHMKKIPNLISTCKRHNIILSIDLKRFKFAFLIGWFIYSNCTHLHAYNVETSGCIIKGADKDSVIVNYLASELRINEERFNAFFGQKLRGKPVRILILKNEEEYNVITQHLLPEWSQGVAIPGQRKIILRPANYFVPELYREIILHELAHIYLAQIIHPAEVPLWFNEGVAMHISDKTISWGEGIAIGNAIMSKNFIDFQDIDSLLNFGETKARLAYLQSLLAVRYLVKVYGPEIVQKILHSMSTGNSFNEAFLIQSGQDIIDFEYDIYHEIKENYKWMSMLQFSNVFWILMIILVLSVFIAIKMRNRKKIKVWESVEEE